MKALAPARVREVRIDEESGTAEVIVPDFQLSLAIGREGQNARLAARLTGWRVDIRSETPARGRAARPPSTPRASGSRTRRVSSCGSRPRAARRSPRPTPVTPAPKAKPPADGEAAAPDDCKCPRYRCRARPSDAERARGRESSRRQDVPSKCRPTKEGATGNGHGLRIRTCVGCRRRADPGELVRLTRRPDGILERGPGPGRGAWLCGPPTTAACLEAAIRRRRWTGRSGAVRRRRDREVCSGETGTMTSA